MILPNLTESFLLERAGTNQNLCDQPKLGMKFEIF